MKLRVKLFAGAIATMLILAGVSRAVAEDVIKIGLLTPLSGPATAFGLASKQAALLALEDVNAKGGVNGKKLELIMYDSQSKPAVAATLAQRLILEDEVPIVCMGTGSIDALAVMEVTERAKVPLLIFASASPVITEKGYKWVWRESVNDRITAEFEARYISSKPNWNRIAILHENSDYGRPPSEILEGIIKTTKGKQIVAMESFNRGDSDVSGQLMKIKKANPDLIVTWGYFVENALIARQKQQIGLGKIPQMGNATLIFPEFIDLAGPAAEGALFMTTLNNYINPAPGVQSFEKRYRERYGKPSGLVSGDNYNGVMIVAEALKRAGTNPEKLQQALNTMNIPGIAYPLKFDAKGQRIVRQLLIGTVEGGKHKFVEIYGNK